MSDELPARDADRWRSWLDSVVLRWDADGLVVTLAGPGAEPLDDGPVHVVTAFNPGGGVVSAAENAFAQHELWSELDRAGRRWAVAVGAVRDGSHHELSAAVWDLPRAQARDLGARHRQRAVYEIDGPDLRVVACDEDRVVSAPRLAEGHHSLGPDHLTRWREEAETILGRGLGRVHCARCGAPDPSRAVEGGGAGWTVPAEATTPPGTLLCRACGHRWGR